MVIVVLNSPRTDNNRRVRQSSPWFLSSSSRIPRPSLVATTAAAAAAAAALLVASWFLFVVQQQQQQQQGNLGPHESSILVMEHAQDRQRYYAQFEAPLGILSQAPFSMFVRKQQEIDWFDNLHRCRQYGYYVNKNATRNPRNRRIFYGAVMQDEPWELLEILAAETFGLFEAMVLMEPSHDEYGQPRKMLRLGAARVLHGLFGVNKVRIVPYNNNNSIRGDMSLDMARSEIVPIWKELGMTVDDVGYMSGLDDTFSRDYLNAMKHCELPEMKYDLHHCLRNRVKVFGNTQVYETSPECISSTQKYEHPDMMIGACIEGIGDPSKHRLAPRHETGVYRDKGWNCQDRQEETASSLVDQKHPLWSGADIRHECGGRQASLRASQHERYSAFHFRNFYKTARDMRRDYRREYSNTPNDLYLNFPLDDAGPDNRLAYRCIKQIDDEPHALVRREPGGFQALRPETPIYFADQAWRKAAHERAKGKILQDELIFESRQEGRKNGDKTETLYSYKSEKEYEAENAQKDNWFPYTDDDWGELVDSGDGESWGDGE